MNLINKSFKSLRSNKSFFLVYIPVVLTVSVVACLILVYPQTSSEGVRRGLSLCTETVIPSLFPFMFIVSLLYDLGAFNFSSTVTDKITYFLFKLPSVAFPIIIMSFIGGYPVGAALIEKAYDDGELTSAQAERMMMFCVNPGPAFTIFVIGSSIIGSAQTGVILFVSVSLSAFITGFLSRFFDKECTAEAVKKTSPAFCCNASLLSGAITKSTQSMVNICVSIILFSCIGELAEKLMPPDGGAVYLSLISEVTNAAITAAESFSLPVVSAVISFAGLCVHFQVLPTIIRLRIKYRLFIAIRILSAALSGVITQIILQIFPRYNAVISLGAKPQQASLEASVPACVCLMLMCGLFLIGDNYILSKRRPI